MTRRSFPLSYPSILEYLIAISPRYQVANKAGKSKMLTEAQLVTRLSRKHLIKQLNQPLETLKRGKSSGRQATYDRKLLEPHLRYLYLQMERISAKRMKVALAEWLTYYKDERCTPQIRLWLTQMSASTLARLLQEVRGSLAASHGISTTQSPARFMKNKVPLNTFDAKIERPGFFQSDTVAHCGTSAKGPFISSLTLTDIDSTWTENRALFTKKGLEVRKTFIDLEQNLPISLLGVNVDSGSEFLNTPMVNFMKAQHRQKPIQFTRSRPYRKNDNCYVEQKNFTHVRELFGYERFDDIVLVQKMNDIYKTCWNPLQNFFIPTFKLKEKVRVGAQVIKKYDSPLTPYQRLMQSPHLTLIEKEALKKKKQLLNPFHLKADLEKKLEDFFDCVRKSKSGIGS